MYPNITCNVLVKDTGFTDMNETCTTRRSKKMVKARTSFIAI